MPFLSFFQQIFCTNVRDKAELKRHDDNDATDCEDSRTNEKYLVLDLDETLIHSAFEAFTDSKHTLRVHYPNQTRTLYFALRPYAHQFLKELSSSYKIMIYTSSKKEYCDYILKRLGIGKYIDKIFYRESCVEIWGKISKDLSMLGVPLKRCVLVDDSVDNSYCQPDNFFLIPSFQGEGDDHTLLDLIPFLKELSGFDDLRRVEQKYGQYLNRVEKEIEASQRIVLN